MADLNRKMAEGHTVSDLDTVIDEVYGAHGDYDTLGDRLDDIDTIIDTAKLGIHYKGEVNYYSNLPTTGVSIGDAYTVKYSGSSGTTPDGTEYVWGTVSGTNQWINFSKDSYTKAEVDALLALKQNALTTAQLAAVNSGIDSTKVAQIETNKNNISYLENTGKKNWLKPDTISGVPTGITVQYESDDSITINGTYSGSEYAYVFLHSFAHEAMQYTLSCNVATAPNTYYFYTRDGYMQSTQTLVHTYTDSDTTRIVMRIAPNTSFDNVNVKLMIRPSIIADSTYQPYTMSNLELTSSIPKVASVTYSLNDLTWTASLDGMIYSNTTVVNGITSIYSAIITGFARLRATDVIIPILSNDGTQIRFMANTGSWVTDAEITLRIVGI